MEQVVPIEIKLTTKSMAETKPAPLPPVATKVELEKHLRNEIVVALTNAGNSPNPFLWVKNQVDPLLEKVAKCTVVDKSLTDRVFTTKYVPASKVVKA